MARQRKRAEVIAHAFRLYHGRRISLAALRDVIATFRSKR